MIVLSAGGLVGFVYLNCVLVGIRVLVCSFVLIWVGCYLFCVSFLVVLLGGLVSIAGWLFISCFAGCA